MVSRRVVLVGLLVVVAVGSAGVLTTDIDGDGIQSLQEYKDGTDPFAGDTDGDGLWDDREYEFGSDPTRADTDGDGLTDQEELFGNPSGTGTTTYDDIIRWERSDPTSKDTDGDGFSDAKEAADGLDPTSKDSDNDGLSDQREVNGPLDPTNPDTDGDNLLDGWEVAGESEKGAPLPDADPLHKNMYIQVMYLRNTPQKAPNGVFLQSKEWFAEMPVHNPDGENGIDARFYYDDEYSGPVDATIDEWVREDGSTTQGVSGFMAMREFYNQKFMGPRTGSYFLVVMAGDGVPVRGSGNAGGSKTSIITPWQGFDRDDDRRKAHTITHELLHNIVWEVQSGAAYDDCNGALHTCEGFLSYENEYFLSDASAEQLNQNGFNGPVYEEQMNATSCEDTIWRPELCHN